MKSFLKIVENIICNVSNSLHARKKFPKGMLKWGHNYIRSFDCQNVILDEKSNLVSQKSSITYDFSHNYEKTKTDSYDSFSLEKMLALDNVLTHIQ